MQFHKFFSETLNQYQGLIAITALLLMVFPFTLKKVRHAVFNFFSKKDIHDRLDSQDLVLGAVVRELTQNGGEGGQKDSTMKDNLGKALRDIASLQSATNQNTATIAEVDTKLTTVTVEVAELRGEFRAFNPNFART